jgi:hypothetical protein
MSAFAVAIGGKADIANSRRHDRFWPKADIGREFCCDAKNSFRNEQNRTKRLICGHITLVAKMPPTAS